MIVLLGLLVLVAVAVFAALGAASSGSRAVRVGAAVPVLVVAGVVVLAVLALGLTGLRSADPDPTATSAATAPTVVTTSTPATTSTTAVRPATPPADAAAPELLGPLVLVRSGGEAGAVGDLDPETVLRLRVDGFDPYTVASVAQCVTLETGRRCTNHVPVQFDEGGTARFQYLVTDEVATGAGRCRSSDAPCSIVVTTLAGAGEATVWTVFGEPLAPPGRLTVTPSTGLSAGQRLTVDLAAFPARTEMVVRLCVRAGDDQPLCEPAGPRTTVRTDGRGRAGTVLPAPAACRDTRCVLSVGSERGFVRSNGVALSFAAPPGVAYDPSRLTAGILVGLALLLLAAWWIRTTDWAPIGEAAAPEIDGAVYADLDAMIAALPPEEEDAVAT